MSEPTSINTALSQRVNANASAEPAPNLKIVDVPAPLENIDRPQKLRGEVTRRDDNGTIHIKTDKGEIKARIEGRVAIEKGDKIEIKIDKGNPPQTATIRSRPKQINTPQIPPQNLTGNLPKLELPPNLLPQEIINGAPIKLDLLTPNLVQKITQPYIENINTNLNLVSNLSIIILEGVAQPPLLENILLGPPTTKLQGQTLPLFDTQSSDITIIKPNSAEEILIQSSAQRPITEIPLRTLIAHIISNPVIAPITIDAITLETPAPSIFSEIIVDEITPPQAQISAPKDEGKLTEKTLETGLQASKVSSTLVGFTEDKHFPVLRITVPENHTDQHYTLQTPIDDIPIGSALELRVTQSIAATSALIVRNAPIATTPPIVISQTSFLTPEIWPVMQEISQALIQTSPHAAQVFSNIIPNAGAPAQLGSAAMFFLAAMRSGDVQSWLGDKVIETLKRAGKSNLLTRLGSEMTGLAKLNSEPISQEWRALTLPLAWQNDIHKMVLHYRKEGEHGADDAQNSGTKTRFIMDLSLSQMGSVQLDGLFVGNPEGIGRLDLILRTQQHFAQSMKAEMRGAYKNALDDTSFTGELSFQDKQDQWVKITPDTVSEFIEDV